MNTSAMHAAIDQDFFAEVLANPEARAAFDDAQARNSLVDALVSLRHALGLTQTEVARRMGVKQPMVSGFENEGSDPRLSTIQRYARAVHATATFSLIAHSHCDWPPRSHSYTPASETHRASLKESGPSPRAIDWVRSSAGQRDFVPAA
jgi:transcriptional regulator with XRE-family HTH domain